MAGINGLESKKIRAICALFLLSVLACSYLFLNRLHESKSAAFRQLEGMYENVRVRGEKQAEFLERAERLLEQYARKQERMESPKKAFDAVCGLLEQSGLQYEQMRRISITENVCFEIAGQDCFRNVLSFFDALPASGLPCRVFEIDLESLPYEEIAYRFVLEFLVTEDK